MRQNILGASSRRDINTNVPDVARPATVTVAASAAEKVFRLIQGVSNMLIPNFVSIMATKRFYSNKAKPGWRENPQFVSREKIPAGEKQKDFQKRYYSWGYRIDLEPIEYEANGTPVRNRWQETGFASRKAAENAASLLKLAEKDEKYSIKKTVFPGISEILQAGANRFVSKKERARSVKIFNRWLKLLGKNIRINELKNRAFETLRRRPQRRNNRRQYQPRNEYHRFCAARSASRFSRPRRLDLPAHPAPESQTLAPRTPHLAR